MKSNNTTAANRLPATRRLGNGRLLAWCDLCAGWHDADPVQLCWCGRPLSAHANQPEGEATA